MSETLDQFWQDILPDVREALNITPNEIYENVARTYVNRIEWSDQATEHGKSLVAGNIHAFAQGVLRPLMIVKDKHIENLKARIATLTDQLTQARSAADEYLKDTDELADKLRQENAQLTDQLAELKTFACPCCNQASCKGDCQLAELHKLSVANAAHIEQIEYLTDQLTSLQADEESATKVMEEYAEVMLAAGCKSKSELLARINPPPDGFASWEDWLWTHGLTIDRGPDPSDNDDGWRVVMDDVEFLINNDTGTCLFPDYSTALSAAKKEAGR